MKPALLFLLSAAIALAGFGPNVRIDHEYRPDHSCINVAIAVGPGAPSSQPVYVAFEDDSMVGIFNVLSDVMFQKSTDAGRTWLPTAVLVRRGAPHVYAPDITTDSDGNVYIVWGDWYVDSTSENVRRNLCVRSSDGGTTWTAPTRVDDRPDSTKRGIDDPRIAADSAGNLFCAWGDGRAGIGHIWSSVSTDQGATWSRNVQVDDDTNDGPGRAQVCVQPGTNRYLVAAQIPRRVGSHWEAGTALYRSTDMGLTFQPGVQIDTSRYDTRHPHIAADRDHIICDYFSQPYRVGDTMIAEARTFYTQADSWGTPVPMTNLDPDHELYYSGELAISGDGRVHTALMVQDTFDGDDNIYYTCSSDHGVSWSDLELVSDDTTVESWYPDIGADSAGHAYIVWYQPNASRGEIWFATNAPVAIAEQPMRPEFSSALNAEPNPFTDNVAVLLGASANRSAVARVYAQDGRLVRQVQISAGEVRWVWDGRDDSGDLLPPGVYVLETGPGVRVKVVKLK
jgi:hypothetical protein